MSEDFLSSLAAQALGMPSAVRPRVASRFEPHPAGGDLRRGWPEPTEIELDAQSSPIPPARDARRSDLATISTLARRAAMTWGIEAEKRAPIGDSLHPSAAAASEHAKPAGGTEGLSMPERSEPGREPAPEPSASASPAHTPDAPSHNRSAVREAMKHSTTDGLAPQSAAVVPEIRPARQDAVPMRAGRAVRETTPPQAPADTGPTIQVTIGRVEVRATTSPAAQRAQPPASPIMTLEEYLRRRTERRNS